MELGLELEISYVVKIEKQVSILVLMELGLERTDGKRDCYINGIGFYPCFNGIRVGTGSMYKD